jgi:hypothetical protein
MQVPRFRQLVVMLFCGLTPIQQRAVKYGFLVSQESARQLVADLKTLVVET